MFEFDRCIATMQTIQSLMARGAAADDVRIRAAILALPTHTSDESDLVMTVADALAMTHFDCTLHELDARRSAEAI